MTKFEKTYLAICILQLIIDLIALGLSFQQQSA